MHKEQSRRIRKETETYQEYVYKMFDIAKQASMESSAVIKYIINGICVEETNKIILYGAKDIRELKEKFALYKAMKENAKTKSKRVEKISKRMSRGEAAQEPKFLCGDETHLSANCPTKSKGARCFKCQEYGHIASKCNNLTKDACSTSQSLQTERCRDVKIEDCRE